MFLREIIVYSRNIINVYSVILSHEWLVLLIKFIVRPTIYVRWRVHIYGTLKVPNNFPISAWLYQ